MSSSTYLRTSSRIKIEGIEYTVYGIALAGGQDRVDDISTFPGLVEKILNDLNHGGVSPVHFRDVLDNLIAQYE